MIKQLIDDLAFERITLGQGLTRAKLIATKTQSKVFKDWIDHESQGYARGSSLPEYRKIPCLTLLVITFPSGLQELMPVTVVDQQQHYDEHEVVDALTQIDSTLTAFSDQVAVTLPLSVYHSYVLAKPFQKAIKKTGGGVHEVQKRCTKAAYRQVIESARQTLLTILVELDARFPHFDSRFIATREHISEVETRVTHQLWRPSSPLTLESTRKRHQPVSLNPIAWNTNSRLEGLGVDNEAIEALKRLMATCEADEAQLKEKVMDWVLGVLTGLMTRGV